MLFHAKLQKYIWYYNNWMYHCHEKILLHPKKSVTLNEQIKQSVSKALSRNVT